MPTLFDLHGIDLNEEAPQQPEKAGFLRRAVGDTGISLVKGAIGVPEAIVGVADLATGGQAGRLAEQAGFRPKEARTALDELLSPQQQAANREVQQASGFMETARAMLSNPSTIYHAAVESAPSLLPAGVVARGAMAGAQRLSPTLAGRIAAAEAAPLVASRGAKTAAELTRLAATGIGEGVVSAGQTAEQVRQETADGLLTGEQSAIAGASGALTGIIGGVAGKIANKLGIGDVNQLVAGVQQAGPAAQKSFVRAMLEGFATEGVLQELPQSAQEQIAQNVALGKPWDEGVGAAAASGALAGGFMGGVAGPMHRSPSHADPVTESLDKLAKAGTVSEMIKAAQEVVGSPTMPAGFDATRENMAMTAMERQMADDASAMRFSGGRERAQPAPITRRAPQAQASATIVPDAPMLDRLATVQESLRDARVRDQVRQQFGEDGLNTLLYYANVANRPGGADGIPDVTRERMLGLAEALISRATLQPVAQPGAVGAAPQAQQLEAPVQVPRIGLDTTPTGRMRADATGNVAPETRADAISTAQRVNARDERLRGGPGMEAQTPRDLPQRLAEQADPVTAYVERQRTVDTPEARQFVRDFNAGKITRRDVIRVMQEQGADPLAGKVYRTRSAASAEARKSGKVVEQVEGGFTVVEQDSGTERGIRGDAGMAAGAGADRGDQPGGSAQPVGSRAAADAGRGDATGLNGQRGGEDVPVRAGDGGGDAVAANGLVRVMTRFGTNTYVRSSDLDGNSDLLRMFTKDGKNNGRIHRENLDPTGEKRAAQAKEDADNPAFNIITRKGGSAFASRSAAFRELQARGLQDSHEVAEATKIKPGASGFVVMRKESASSAIDQAANEAATSPSNDLPEPTDAQKEGLTASGRYRDGGEWSAEYEPVQRNDGQWMLVRKLSDSDGQRTEYLDADGSWVKGTPSRIAVSGVGQIGGADVFPSRQHAVNAAQSQHETSSFKPGKVFQSVTGEKTADELKARLPEMEKAKPVSPVVDEPAGFDSAAWDKARNDRIEASRAAGNVHLDEVPAYVETMRGKNIFYVHDTKVRGTIRTVDTRGNVYVNWADAYSAEKEMAQPVRDGKKVVMQSSIGPRDLKDYALATEKAKPVEAREEVTRSNQPLSDREQREAKAKAQADLDAALGDLGDIFGKNTRLGIMPEQEQKLLPVLTRVLDAAFRLGYYKFKDAARFALQTIRAKLGDDVADQLTLEHLQGAYIAMSGKYRDKGAETVSAVAAVESLADLAPAATTAAPAAAPPVSSREGQMRRGDTVGRELRVTEIQKAVSRLSADWLRRPDIYVIDSMDDAPGPVREEWLQQNSQGASGSIEGFHYRGGVYLVAEALSSEADVRRVLFHEALGHFGLQNVFGNGLNPILAQLATMRPQLIRAKAKQYGLDLSIESDRLMAAEEVLAELAQSRPELGWVQRAISAIRRWLRAHGVSLGLSDNDIIADYILPARGWVERGRAAAPSLMRGPAMAARSNAGRDPFYSALSAEVDKIGAKAMPAAGWASALTGMVNKGAVKADEVEWSGIREWLDLQTGKVSKEDVLAYLDANGVQVQEVTLGGSKSGIDEWEVVRNGPEDYDVVNGAGDVVESGFLARSTAQEFIDSEIKKDGTKYSQYTLPGGENYREVLLTLPERAKKETWEWYDPDSGESKQGFASQQEAYEDRPSISAVVSKVEAKDSPQNFRSSHWDQPNVLAHIRLNDRTDSDGKRVLFVEEVQSDYAQDARKQGIKTGKEASNFSTFAERRGIPQAEWQRMWDNQDKLTGKDAVLWAEWQAELKRGANGVTAAPFIDSTDKWLTLALKRVMVMAAQEGYDRVAFVNGEQSADRYSLSKSVDSINWQDLSSELRTVQIDMQGSAYGGDIGLKVNKSGVVEMVTSGPTDLKGKNLEDVIGKAAAEKIMAEPKGNLSGDGLKIGGEGMIAFYDKIVPAAVNKLLGKVGGGKLETVQIASGDRIADDEFGEADTRIEEVRRNGEVSYETSDGRQFDTYADAVEHEQGISENNIELKPQPGFTITPAMAETLARGMPMFSRQGDQTETPAFRAWFGDSKVVDAEGKPLVVYHGTQDSIEVFEPGWKQLERGATPAELRSGSIAEIYRRLKEDPEIHFFAEEQATAGSYGPEVMQVYLSIRNPVYAEDRDEAIQRMLDEGADGARFPDTTSSGRHGGYAWVVRDSRQIKSAIGNSGAFDASNPDIRFSRSSKLPNGLPHALVQKYAKQYEAAGLHRVNVARNISDLPERLQAKMSGAGDDVRGAYFRAEDQVWLFSDRLNSMDELHFVVIHEAFHRGLGHLFGEDGRKIMRQMYATNKALRDRADMVAKELKIDRDEAIEEALADMAGEGGVESLRGWKGLVQLIRKWLLGLATRLGVPLRFSDAQIRAFVAGVAGAGLRAQKAEPVLLTRERDMVMASREGQRDQTDTPEFKRWFGDSKVVDEQGRPLVVYHGTPTVTFTEFDVGNVGAFFSDRFDVAASYAGRYNEVEFDDEGAYTDDGTDQGVYEAYLAIRNPLVMDWGGRDWGLGPEGIKLDDWASRAKRAGHDGLIVENVVDSGWLAPGLVDGAGTGRVFVAFRPEQIKSAIGNSGAFDGSNPDIRFSRSSPLSSINQQAIRDKVSDLFSNAGEKVSWWDKTIGTQYNKAKKHPAFKRVFDHVQQYVEDTSTLANEAADKAPAILPKLESVRDVFAAHARGLSTEDKVAVAAPIFEGTLDWARIGGKLVRIDDAARSAEQMSTAQKARRLVDDGRVSQEEVDRWENSALPIYEGAIRNRYEQAYLTPGVVFNRQELRDLFKLNERQIEQYEQFRSAVNESLDQVATADALRLLGESPAELRAMAMGDRAAFRAGLVDYMEERIAEEEDTDVREQLRQTMADIEDKFNRVDDMKARGYAPLMRFGKFLVSVKGAEGEQEWFSLHETKAEANKMARELQGDPQFRGRVRQGVLSEEAYKLFSSIPVESLEMFAGALGAEKSAVFQEYLRMTKNNRSALKRLIQRKGTAGFSDEVSRVLASFVASNARLAAGAMNMPAAKEAADEIRDGDLKDEGVKLIETVQNPTDTAGVLRGLMFTHFIGGSIASALVNVTQPVMMTLPWLSQWGGGVKAASRLMASARMAAGGKIADTELAKALERAEKDGIVSPQEIHHLTAEAMATWGKNPWLKRVAFIWSAPFSVAEQFNRRVTFLAAYKTAKEEGIADPFAFAQEAVVETQGLYNKGNSANWTRNPIGATALTFKQYSVHYLEWIKRMWNAGEPGSRERTEGRRAVLLAMALLFAAGGAEGLPFAEDLDDLADTIMQALGFDTSAKGWKREFIAKTLGLGDEGADVLMRGLSAVPGIPLDVSMRMGMGNLLPGTGMLLKSTTDASRDIAELAGPAGSLLTQWKDAGKKALDGDIPGAMLGAMPGAIQNMGKAASMWMNGEARDTKGRRIMQTDEIDGFMRFLGFNPSEIARESARLSEQDRRVRLTRAVESSIADQWAQGMRDGNADAVQEARAQLQEWNDTNPESRISINSAQIKRRLKDLGEDRSARFERAAPRELRGSIQGALN